MNNKIPQEIEEKYNHIYRLGFKAGQKQKQDDIIKLNAKNQSHIKRQSNQINLLLEKVSFLKEKIEELKSKLTGGEE